MSKRNMQIHRNRNGLIIIDIGSAIYISSDRDNFGHTYSNLNSCYLFQHQDMD